MKSIAVLLCALAVLIADTGNRRKTDNKMSPSAQTSMKVGGQDVTIEYNAPSARGRKVEGGLIPYGEVWRLGADSATTLTANTNLKIGDLAVPKGVYTLYIAAGESGWKLVVNKQKVQWGTEYNEPQDLGRVPLKLTELSAPVETLKITLAGGMPEIEWGSTKATVPVKQG
jgi:DUF2911 family protein